MLVGLLGAKISSPYHASLVGFIGIFLIVISQSEKFVNFLLFSISFFSSRVTRGASFVVVVITVAHV